MDYREILKENVSKANFVKGLIRLAKVDGIISEEERQYFMLSASNLDVGMEQLEEIEQSIDSIEKILVHFGTNKEKVLFLREAIQLCAIDGKYDEREKAEIREIALEMNVPDSCIKVLENWVKEGMDWKERGDDLLNFRF